MSRDTYGKIPKYLAKRKTEGADGEPSEDALLVKSTIPKKSALTGRPSKVLDKDKPRNTTATGRTKTPDEVISSEKRKSVKRESRLERMDSERHVRIASKLGDEPAKRRSSSRIPRRNSSDMLPVATSRDRRKSSIHQTQIRRGSRIPGLLFQSSCISLKLLYFKYQKQTYTKCQNQERHQPDANQLDVNQLITGGILFELSRQSTHHHNKWKMSRVGSNAS